MPSRFNNPYPQFLNSTPALYSGGKLYFYQAGSSTPLDTYSNAGLSIANTNPVVLNSAGRPAVDIFMSDAAYKVVLTDSGGTVIWTADPYHPPEYSVVAQFTSYAGNPNGNVAGTAASSGVPADAVWDRTNNILYVCTVSGVAAAAVWTAINATTSTTAVTAPQGRLTLTSATPILASDTLSQTSVYYTPYVGNQIPIYNGSSTLPATFSELTLTLVASHVANSIYDVFVFSNSGALTLVTGPAWNTITPGSGARGTGAGTTQLSRLNGYWVNTVQMTGRNGSTTYTVDANKGTYVGSVYIDNTAGQCSCTVAYGQNRKWGVWNAYNRVPVVLRVGDSTASWTYASATVRASNNAPATYSATVGNYNTTASNSGMVFCGLADEVVRTTLSQKGAMSANSGATCTMSIGLGLNSATAVATDARKGGLNVLAVSSAITQTGIMVASHELVPAIGVNTLVCLEDVANAATTQTYSGTSTNMSMLIEWRG